MKENAIRVLLVEDNPGDARLLKEYLAESGRDRFEIAHAERLSGGLQLVRDERFDIVLLDLNLPDSEGLDTVARMHRQANDIPIIVLTGADDEETAISAAREGAQDYLVKGQVDSNVLVRSVRYAIERKRAEAALRDSEARANKAQQQLLDAIESSGASFILYDADERLVLCNNKSREILREISDFLVPGASIEDLSRARAERVTPALDEAEIEERVRTRLDQFRHPGPAIDEHHADGRWTQAFERKTADGGTVCVRVDVTEIKRAEAAIRKLSRRNELILGAVGEGIYGLDLEGRTTFVNPTAARMIGWQPEELIGRSQHDILHHTKPEGSPYPREECPIYAALKDGETHHVSDDVFWRKDGTSFPVAYTSTPIREDGEVVGAVVVFRDIGEQKKAEAALRDSEARANKAQQQLFDAVETISDGFAVYDSDAHLVLCNSKYREIYELDGNRLAPGDRFEDIARSVANSGLIAEAVGREEEWLRERVRLHRNPRGAFERCYADGRWLRISERKTGDGGIVALRTDITELKSRERQLADNAAILEATLGNIDQGITLFDAELKLAAHNQRFLELLEIPPGRFGTGTRYEHFIRFLAERGEYGHGDVDELVRERVAEVRSLEPIYTERVRPNGTVLEYRRNPLQGGGLVTTYTDITERKRAEEELRRSEDQLRLITDNLPVLIAYLDAEQRYQFINDTCQNWFRLSRSDVLGRQAKEIFKTEYYKIQPWIEAALTGKDVTYEQAISYPDGVTREVQLNYIPHRDEGGCVRGCFVLAQDIIERKRAEEELRRSEASLANAQRIAHIGNWERNLATNEVRGSAELFRLIGMREGYPDTTLAGLLERVHPDDRAILQKALAEALESDGSVDYQYRIVLPDGTIRVLHEQAEIRRDDTGKPTHLVGTTQDITEMTRRERELRESRQRLRLITDALPAYIAYVNAEQRFGFANKAYEELFERSQAEIVGMRVEEVFGPDRYRKAEPYITAALSGETVDFETDITLISGDHRHLHAFYVPDVGETGDIVGFSALIHDITESRRAEAAVRRSEQHIRAILNSVADCVVTIDEAGIVQSFNPAAERTFGYSADEVVGSNVSMLMSEADGDRHDGYIGNYRRTGKARILGHGEREVVGRRKDGSTFSLELAIAEMTTDDKVLFIGTLRDITERKRAEEALRESEARLADAQRIARIGNWEWNLETGEIHRSAEMSRLFGVMHEGADANSDAFFERIHADDRADQKMAFSALAKTGERFNHELRVVLPDGTSRVLHEQGEVKLERNGKPAIIAGTTQDISERALAEKTSRRLAAAIEGLSETFVLFDADDRIIVCNEAFRKLNQAVSESTAPGTRFEDYLRAMVAKRMVLNAWGREEEWVQERLRQHRNPIGPFEIARQNGRHVLVSEHRLSDGGTATISADITEQKRAAEELIAAKEEAELANRAKSEFLANMSHELRTPLNAVIGFSEMIRTEVFGEIGNAKYLEYARDINESGAHLLELITDILDLSKIEAGRLELYEEHVDVARVVGSCLTLVKDRAEAGGLSLGRRIPPELPALRADERKLKQILLNLLSNAVKFTPEGGTVTLAVAVESRGGFLIQVVDSGIGIAPEDIATAMSPFGQVDSALSRKYEGTGLGLPLTKALVELHGATLDLDSEVGVGTTATVRFPQERIVSQSASAA